MAGEASGSRNLGQCLPAGWGAVLVNVFVISFRVATQDYEQLRWRRLPRPLPRRRKKPKAESWRTVLSLTRVKRPVPLQWLQRQPWLPKEVLSVLHAWRAAGVFFISLLGFNEGGWEPRHQGHMLGLWGQQAGRHCFWESFAQ